MMIITTAASRARTRQVRLALRAYGLHPVHLYAARWATWRAPYHNYQHCYQVALDVIEGGTAIGLKVDQIKVLLVAALYHDHNHTGDAKVADQVNIRRALRGAYRWLSLLGRNLSRQERETARWLIAMTENSHSTPSNMVEVDVIRDADLLTTTAHDGHAWQAALSREQHMQVDDASTLQFLTAHPLTTIWGRRRVADFAARIQNL